MSKTKAVIDYTRYEDSALGTLAQIVHDMFEENAATFTAPPKALTLFQTQITSYKAKLQAKESGSITDINAFNDARAEMNATMAAFGNYVNSVAAGNPTIVGLSGMPFYGTTRQPDNTPPNAPQNLRLRHDELPGAIIALYSPERSPSVNEVQTCTGDPGVEANWTTRGMFKGGRAELDGFPPGIIVYARVRTVGKKAVMGPWSDIANIRTL